MRGSCYLMRGLINAEQSQTLDVGGHWGEERSSGARWCQSSVFLADPTQSGHYEGSQTSAWCFSHVTLLQNCVTLHITHCVTWAHCHEECDTALHITSHTPKHHCVRAAWQGTWHVMTPADSFTRSQSVQVYSTGLPVSPLCTPVHSQAAPGLWSSHTSRSVGSGHQRMTQVWHQTWIEGTLLQNTNN